MRGNPVVAYLARLPPPQRAALQKLRKDSLASGARGRGVHQLLAPRVPPGRSAPGGGERSEGAGAKFGGRR